MFWMSNSLGLTTLIWNFAMNRPLRGCLKPRFESWVLVQSYWYESEFLFSCKLIFTRKVLHLASFWKCKFLELGLVIVYLSVTQSCDKTCHSKKPQHSNSNSMFFVSDIAWIIVMPSPKIHNSPLSNLRMLNSRHCQPTYKETTGR